MFKRLRKFNVEYVTNKPKRVLLAAFIFTLIMIGLASTLKMELSWVALAPKNDKAVIEYQEILENFPTLDNMIIIVESENAASMEAAASEVAAMLRENKEYIANVTLGIERDFLVDYGLIYMEPQEIEMMAYMFMDLNLDSFYHRMNGLMLELEKASEQGDITLEELEQQMGFVDNLPYLLVLQAKAAAGDTITEQEVDDTLERLLVGNGLMTSKNGRMAMLSVMPSFELTDIEKLEPGVAFVENAVKTVDERYEDVTLKVTGMHVVGRDEAASIASDSQLTTIISFALILIILYVVFRSFAAPLLAFVPLIFGIIWSMGLSALTIGRLNMMTAFSAAMILGLGIDYAIHMYSSYTEKRVKGYSKEDSLKLAIEISGPGIITGALTTAVAFFALNISKLELLNELGTVMGTGILMTLLAVFWILPALIILKKEKEAKVQKITGEFRWIGIAAEFVHRFRYVVLILIVAAGSFMGYQSTKITFDSNLMNLEPEGLESIEVMNYLVEEYDMSADAFSLQVDSLDEVYELQERLSEVEGVFEVNSVAAVRPKAELQKERLDAVSKIKPYLEMAQPYHDTDIASLQTAGQDMAVILNGYAKQNYPFESLTKEELLILADNLEEGFGSMQASDSLDQFTELFYNQFNMISGRMLIDQTVTVDKLPEAFYQQFVSADGSHYIITIVPDFDIWSNMDTEKGLNFFRDIRKINESITGTPLFMKVLYDSVSDELVLTGAVLFAILIIILLLHFKSIKYTVLALLPLIFTLIFMIGTMTLSGQSFNMLNFLSILLVIGIGLDDGVHILHHYKMGDKNMKSLFAAVGRAISLTTMTTVFGFGSLMFSSYRGIASLGKALSIGVTFAFVMTVVILPIFLKNEKQADV